MLTSCDNCQLIKNVDNWEIELIPANNLIKSNFFILIGKVIKKLIVNKKY